MFLIFREVLGSAFCPPPRWLPLHILQCMERFWWREEEPAWNMITRADPVAPMFFFFVNLLT